MATTRSGLASPQLCPGLDRGEHAITRLLSHFRPLVSDHWLALPFSDPPREAVIASCGTVEIRQTESGFAAETCVKGELGEARVTALERLGRFIRRSHRDSISLRTIRPLVQTAQEPDRWLVRIGLADGGAAAASRKDRVTIRFLPAETIAIVGLSSSDAPRLIARGAAMIRDAIAETPWEEAGSPMLRLCSPLAIMPFAGRLEVGLRVVRR
ncbi:MAG TPA: hypothetical protein VMA37_00970 [Acetobacteraceae bacterium]|nr:hypothetical protein [Acetobacteraceae bacterium]